MSDGTCLPFATDRRQLAAQMCHLLAHSVEDPGLSLDQLGRVAQEIAAFLLEREQALASGPPLLKVIEGGRE